MKNRGKFIALEGIDGSGKTTQVAKLVENLKSLNVRVEATNGLQISTNANDWKSVITNADITTGYTNAEITSANQLPATVTNVSTDGTVDTTTGRLNLYYGIIGNHATSGAYTIYTTKETDAAGTTGRYVAFDVFLRVDQNQTIYLTTDSNVVANGEDKGLKNAARVGFVTLGHGSSTDTVVNLTKLSNTIATNAIIWEPNIDTHSTMVTDTVAPEYGVTIPATGSVPYRGINKAIAAAAAADLKNTINGTDTSNTTAVTPDIKTTYGFATYQQAFQLTTGVTKMRIYMWIEGQDIDCENGATGSNITFNLQLSTQSSASGS